MPLFHYKAVTPDGVTVSGEMEAPSQLAVVERLQAQGHFPLTADEHKKETRAARRLFGPKKPSSARLALMTGEVATLLEAGLPLDRALELARDVAETPEGRAVLERLLTRIRGGSSFAQALGDEGDYFPKIYVSTIQAGEAGAALGPVMRRLGTYLEKAAALRETVKSALVYPIILAVVVLGSIVILLTVVVPQFKPMFEEAGRALPLPTQIVVAGSSRVDLQACKLEYSIVSPK